MKFIIETSHGKDKMHCHLASSQFAFQLLEAVGTTMCLQFCDVTLWKKIFLRDSLQLSRCVYVSMYLVEIKLQMLKCLPCVPLNMIIG